MTSKKYSIVLNKNLRLKSSGITLNTVAHICAQLGTLAPELKGATVTDTSGLEHSGIPIHPNAVLYAKEGQLRNLVENAIRAEGLIVVDYPKEGFETETDAQFCEAISQQGHNEIVYWGVAIYGDTEKVNSLTKKFSLWNYPYQV